MRFSLINAEEIFVKIEYKQQSASFKLNALIKKINLIFLAK